MSPQTADGQQGTYRLRREGRGPGRRYVVMLTDSDGRVQWEWEPMRKGRVVRRLAASGEHTTDVFELIHAADDEWAGRVSRFRDTEDLWGTVARLRDELRENGQDGAADRLQEAMTISAHPGEVWPATLAVLRDLLREPPPGLDKDAATACVDALSRWS